MRLRFIAAFVSLPLVVAIFVLVVMPHGRESSLFKRLVADPIPASVQEIRVDRSQISSLMERLNGFHEHAYVLRFTVNRKDLGQIVAAHGFKPWRSVECLGSGIVRYKSSDQFLTYINLYDETRQAPSWFDLKEWTEFETYFTGRDKTGEINVDVSLLLYNERCGHAYFIKWEMRM
jgi:hypothetical protein